MDTQTPDNPIVKFLRSKAAIPVGFILALALGIFFMYQGIDKTCCIGSLLIAVLMFLLLKFFNSKSTKLLVIFAVIFFVASTLIGAFAVSAPYMDQKQNYEGFESSNFSDLSITYDADLTEVTVTVSYSGTDMKVYTEFRPLAWISYGLYNAAASSDEYTHEMTLVTPGIYSATFKVKSDTAYDIDFYSKNAEDTKIDATRDLFYVSDGFNKNIFCLQWNAYYACIPSIIFVLIAVITLWLRKRLEKERKKMEADGRLYPEGYGRCKECGSIVLPGEVSCRKCGAYIDVPENMRVKKVDSFFCTDCGAEVPGDAKVCPKCGAKFDDDTETVVVEDKVQNTCESFQCSDCGATVPGNATVCPNCGAKFDEDDELRKCPKCGTEVPDYAEHCHKCGAKLK